jgi:transcriptional regulator with XRE-family HTH domain
VAAREQAGLSQVQLAERMGVSQQVVAAWERKAKALRSDTLARLAKILKVPTDQLLGIKTSRSKAPAGKARRVLDDLSKLPRRRQNQILNVVEDMVSASEK